MASQSMAKPYDAFYYAHSCGRPYQRDEVWLNFFASVAERIVSDIRPTTVLDAGCAMGFLVEALRDRGVDAVGVDISEYAIQQVRPDIRPSCWVGSLLDPLPQKYDLIVCIEVLEHLSPSEAEQVIENFCQHTDDVLFSSTPSDYKEVTHCNVQPPDYWAELFARRGFFHDVEFDVSFLSHWAVRFRRTREPVARVIAAYARRLWRLEQDNRARRELALEQRNTVAEQDQQVQMLRMEASEKARQVQMLQGEVTEKEQALQREMAEKEQALQREMAEKEQALQREMAEKEQVVQALRAEVTEKDRATQALRAEVEAVQALHTEMMEKEQRLLGLSTQVANLHKRLSEIEVDYGWRLLQKMKKVRLRFAPHGSRRERWFLQGLRFMALIPSAGPIKLFRRGLNRLQRRGPVADPTDTVAEQGAPLTEVAVSRGLEASPALVRTETQGWGRQVLVVSGSTGDMERYRCHHVREQLQLFGMGCEVRHITDPQVMALLPQYKLVIIHRVAHDQWVEHMIAIAHNAYGATVVFDIDDLVFQPELDQWIHALQTMSPADQALFREGMQRYRRTLELCDGVLAATEAIAEAARRMGKPAWVHRNALSLEMLALSERAYRQRVSIAGKVVIGYASGTRTHNRDFAEAASALERILQTYPQTELWIIGHLDLDRRWDQWGGRIKQVPFMPWQQLPRTLASLDINLAPLEIPNLFCASKSELKYIEAAAVGVPTVASRWGAFAVALQPGKTGFLAATPAEWYDALERLVTNPALRQTMGEHARTDVLLRYSPTTKGQELLATFDDMVKVLTEKNGLAENLGTKSARDDPPQENQYGMAHPPLDGPLRFPEHGLAHQFLDDLSGLEIGAAAHNPFGLHTRNVAPREDYEFYAEEARKLGVDPAPIDIVALADDLPLPDESEDFVLSSHVVEHLANVIKGFVEWDRVVRDRGYVFMIVPLKGALPADGPRELTPFEHFVADYRDQVTIATHPIEDVPGGKMGHYHTFTSDSLLAVVEWMQNAGLCDWELVAREDVDSKVGNGFTLVFRVRHQSHARAQQTQN